MQYSSADRGKGANPFIGALVAAIQEGRATADVYSLAQWTGEPHAFGDPHALQHVGLEAVWRERLLPALGLTESLPFRTFFSNQWLARPRLVSAYAQWLAHVALPAVEEDARVFAPAWDREQQPHMKAVAPALAALGYADWPLLCYLQERLAAFYFQRILHDVVVRDQGDILSQRF